MRKNILFLFLMSLVCTMAVFGQKVTLHVFDYVDATAPSYAGDQQIWKKFTDTNPDITIVREELSNEPFHQKLAAYVAAGTLPDLIYMYPSGRSTMLHEQKLVKDLTPLLGKEYLTNFVSTAVDPAGQKSKYLAELPQSICYTTVVFANTKLLSQLGLKTPKTYADLKAMLPKLRAKGIRPVLMANKDSWVMQSCLFSTIVGRELGDSWVDSVLAGTAKFTDPGFIKALNFVKQLYTDGVLSKDTLQISYGEAPALFASGKAAFLIDGDWRQSAFLTDKSSNTALISPDKQASDFSYINFPSIPGEKNPGVASAILGCGYGISSAIPSGSDKEKAALKLLKYLYSPEVQQTRLEIGSFIPSRKGITSKSVEPFTTKMSAYYGSIKKTCYVLDGVFDTAVSTPLNTDLQEIGLGTKTAEQVAQELQTILDAQRAAKK